MREKDQERIALTERSYKYRQDQIQQQKAYSRAEKMKLGEFKTHFHDVVAQENAELKAKVNEDFDIRATNQIIRKEYAERIPKPKVDDNLREKLKTEIKKPTTFMGRQSAHADMSYSLHNVQIGVPKSNYLTNQTTPFPEINLQKFGTGRNSIQSVLQNTVDDSTSLKRDREYIRRIISD